MEQNTGGKDVKALMEMWDSIAAGSISVAKQVQKTQDFVDEIMADTERRDNVSGVLMANGLSTQQVQLKLLGANNIKTAILSEFPNAIPTQE